MQLRVLEIHMLVFSMHEVLSSVSNSWPLLCSPGIPSPWEMITGAPEIVPGNFVGFRLAWDIWDCPEGQCWGTSVCVPAMFAVLCECLVSVTLMFGVAGERSTHSRMNSGTRTVSVNERPPAHVCRREQLSLSQTLGLHFITRGSVDVEPLPGLHNYLVCKADTFTLKILQMD